MGLKPSIASFDGFWVGFQLFSIFCGLGFVKFEDVEINFHDKCIDSKNNSFISHQIIVSDFAVAHAKIRQFSNKKSFVLACLSFIPESGRILLRVYAVWDLF